jgi:hypothetical protein
MSFLYAGRSIEGFDMTFSLFFPLVFRRYLFLVFLSGILLNAVHAQDLKLLTAARQAMERNRYAEAELLYRMVL